MLQHWASDDKFYVGNFVSGNFTEPIMFACCMLTSLYYVNKQVMFAHCTGKTKRRDIW